ncbi:ATP-binding protein [Paraburkholderia nemoris]|uniref:ATP-binding protein n=1 Tax=Paraburkholderia nemoris TaxID=2793076 RepID=UPI001B193ED9|nr:ATP-binding protein [Paraburkholderia nemoris]CAE6732657.1 Chaperone protein HtpG [Paraburkholderia nemoris]
MTNTSEKIPFSVEISRMIEVLAAQIYPSPFALLRENVQNSFDAILIRKHLGQEFTPRIDVTIEPNRISVLDNGVGMSREDLRNHFWKAGSSSKNTADARAAGVVGTFGIGAMANFGIAEELLVISESALNGERTECSAHRSTLSVTEDCIGFRQLVPLGAPGTQISATMQVGKSIDVAQAVSYLKGFVSHLQIEVNINGELATGQPIEEAVPRLVESWRYSEEHASIGPHLIADVELTGAITGEVRIDLSNIQLDGTPIYGRMVLRQGLGSLRTFRSRFGLATAGVATTYNFGGVADFLFLQPTAGREALTTESLQALQRLVTPIDEFVSLKLAERPESNANAQFVAWAASRGRWDLCGQLRVRIEPAESASLQVVCARSHELPVIVYAGNDPSTIALASAERPMVLLSRGSPRKDMELAFLRNRGNISELTDEPKVLSSKAVDDYTLGESALAFRLSSILSSDYFLNVEIRFGKISHGLPILAKRDSVPVSIVLDPDGQSVRLMLDVYDREYVAFGHMAKDFVRNVIFPKIADLVPSATRQGAEAFLKSIHRNREIFEYEVADLENLASLWQDYLSGKLTMEQAATRSGGVARSYQVIDASVAAAVRDVVPDVVDNERDMRGAEAHQPSYEAAPSIQRLDIQTDCKLLTIPDNEEPLNGYRCFIAITDRVREERGDFFLQPHRTSVVWGGQKALFIFEHQSGGFGLYYDVQTPGLIANQSGGGAFETSTIVMKNRIFIPLPEGLQSSFLPQPGERKRLEVRCDILYIDRD